MLNSDYHDIMTIRETQSQYHYYQGSNILIHQDTIAISKSHNILMNFIDFIKTELPVKISNISALSNISLAIITSNIFAKQKTFLCSYIVNLDKKASDLEW